MRGKLAILLIFVVAFSASGFAWWWNYQRSANARLFWGPAAATLRSAGQVEALRIAAADENPATLPSRIDIGKESLAILDRKDISHARGLLNARYALTVDESFDWSTPPVRFDPHDYWPTGVRFTDQSGKTVTLLFHRDSNSLLFAEAGREILLNEKTAQAWKNYVERAFAGKLD